MTAPEICFLLAEQETERMEKRCFFEAQAALLEAAGIPARLASMDGTLPPPGTGGRIMVFDLANRDQAPSVPDGDRVWFAPVLWDPYALFDPQMTWMRREARCLALLVSGEHEVELVRKYPIGQQVLPLHFAMNYADLERRAAEREAAGPLVIGCLGRKKAALDFLRGMLTRLQPAAARAEWVELDFEDRDAWLRDLPRCDLLLAMRSYSGSALPLLEAMAAGVPVCADHGGALSRLASADNGTWLESATLERCAETVAHLLERFAGPGPQLSGICANAARAAGQASAAATFPENLNSWRSLMALCAPS